MAEDSVSCCQGVFNSFVGEFSFYLGIEMYTALWFTSSCASLCYTVPLGEYMNIYFIYVSICFVVCIKVALHQKAYDICPFVISLFLQK